MPPASKSIWRRVRRGAWVVARPLLEPLGSLAGAATQEPVLALTFDDGPEEPTTSRILDLLATHDAHATFFVLVDRAAAAPEIVERIRREGHDVGLHGADHTRLTEMGFGPARRHLRTGRDQLAALTGRPVRYFRPPYGAQSLGTYLAARSLGLLPVIWTDDGGDWRPDLDVESVVGASALNVEPGAIVVLHDGFVLDAGERARTGVDRVRIVERILDALRARGLRSVRLTRLLESGRPKRRIWFHR